MTCATIFAPLASNNGAQSYNIPADSYVNAFNEIYLWWAQYDVPLGVAKLTN